MSNLTLQVLQKAGNLKLEITASDLASVLEQTIRDITMQFKSWMTLDRSTELIPRKEAKELLRVKSNVTMIRWEEKGFLKPRRIGNRVFYNRMEVIEAVEEFER